MRPDFLRAREAATALLLGQTLRSLRIEVMDLAYERNVLFDSMQRFCTVTRTTMGQLSDGSDCLRDGCTLIRSRGGAVYYIVLYNEKAPNYGRRNFTLAHEIGHIYLDHQQDSDAQEQEANAFAAQLLAPEILVHALGQRTQGQLTPAVLTGTFSLSAQAAEYRIQALRRTPNPRFSPLEQALLEHLGHLLPQPGVPDITY